MQYFVVFPDGQRFGPADITLLNLWIQEGRVLPTMILEDASTGQRFQASSLSGLMFPNMTQIPTYQPTIQMSPRQDAQAPVQAPNEPQRVGDGYCCPRCNAYLAPGSRACVQCGQMFAYTVPLPGQAPVAGVGASGAYPTHLGGQGPIPYGGQPGYPVTYGEMLNTSGQKGSVPPEITSFKWNWGAFCLSPFWLIAHGLAGWGIGMILINVITAFAPGAWIIPLAIQIYLGAQGHKIAWQNRRFENLEHYKQVQTRWMWWGIAVSSVFFCLGILIGIGVILNPNILR